MDNDNNIDIGRAVIAGLETLNDREIKVRSDLVEDLGVLKNILRAISSGQLVVATRDRLLPTDAERPDTLVKEE